MEVINTPAAKEMLPISALEFGFYHLDAAVTATVAQAIIVKFDVLQSEGVTWEVCESDGSPAINFDLDQHPWLLEGKAFKPEIDGMYRECLEMIEDMASSKGIGANFRYVSVYFVDQPSTVDCLTQIFNLDYP